MREYAKVSPLFWTGETGRRIRALPPDVRRDAQVVAFYLLTAPHANYLGLYYLPVAYIAHDTGMPIEGASKALASLCEVGFCAYDELSEVVWVYEMARFQIADALDPRDKQVKGIAKALHQVPKCPFRKAFAEKYAAAFHLDPSEYEIPLGCPFEGSSKPLRSKEIEIETEIETENKGEKNARTHTRDLPPLTTDSTAQQTVLPDPEDDDAALAAAPQECLALAQAMWRDIERSVPGVSRPSLLSWVWDLQALVAEGHSLDEIKSLWDWARADPYWSHVVSPRRLRERWNELCARRAAARSGPATPSTSARSARNAAVLKAFAREGGGGDVRRQHKGDTT